jgi:steroid delta-isomerase
MNNYVNGNRSKAVAEYFAATRAMDAERWVAVFAEDATSHDPVGAPAMNGHGAARISFKALQHRSIKLD